MAFFNSLLELDLLVDRWNYKSRGGRTSRPKLVHNIILSMPARTAPDRLLAASRAFAREEFALQHRYALVMHTDQDHPHVHLVVSAHRMDRRRLNIGKADLRRWREQFARQLRREGVEANATPAQLRGKLTRHARDGSYRTTNSKQGNGAPQGASAERIRETAAAVQADWRETVTALHLQAEDGLANEVERFRRALAARGPATAPTREDDAPEPPVRRPELERTR